jgi:hypothetical protein
MDNPETMATLVTQDTGQRQPKKNNNNNHTIQKTIKMTKPVPHQKLGLNPGAHEG